MRRVIVVLALTIAACGSSSSDPADTGVSGSGTDSWDHCCRCLDDQGCLVQVDEPLADCIADGTEYAFGHTYPECLQFCIDKYGLCDELKDYAHK